MAQVVRQGSDMLGPQHPDLQSLDKCTVHTLELGSKDERDIARLKKWETHNMITSARRPPELVPRAPLCSSLLVQQLLVCFGHSPASHARRMWGAHLSLLWHANPCIPSSMIDSVAAAQPRLRAVARARVSTRWTGTGCISPSPAPTK